MSTAQYFKKVSPKTIETFKSNSVCKNNSEVNSLNLKIYKNVTSFMKDEIASENHLININKDICWKKNAAFV